MQNHVDDSATTAFHRQCINVYQNHGLTGFIRQVNRYEPANSGAFRHLVYYASHYFGVQMSQMATDLHFSTATISRWVNHGSCPSIHDRKVVKEYILNQLHKQLTTMTVDAAE